MNWNRTQNFGKCHFQIPQGSRDERLSWSSNLPTCTAALTTHLNHMLLKQLNEVARTISIQQISPLEVVVMYFFMKKSILQQKFTSSPHPLARSEGFRHFKG